MPSISARRRGYDAFEHLCHVAFPEGSKGRLMAMLTAYFDESYSHKTLAEPDKPLVYTVAGWVATVEGWRAFRKEWKKALRQ